MGFFIGLGGWFILVVGYKCLFEEWNWGTIVYFVSCLEGSC